MIPPSFDEFDAIRNTIRRYMLRVKPFKQLPGETQQIRPIMAARLTNCPVDPVAANDIPLPF